MKAIHVATICHNEDDALDPKHRRVKLKLIKDPNNLMYYWLDEFGYDTFVGGFFSVKEALSAALCAWGSPYWGLKAKWLK